MKNSNFISAVTASLLFIGCGGDGSDSPISTNNEATVNGTSSEIGTGYYVDAAVAGVRFKCGIEEGLTDVDGKFIFEKGKSCTFKLGDLVLRELNATSLENNVTVFEDNAEVAKLLQTMDRDGNASNGIDILPETHEVIMEQKIKEVPTSDEILEEIKDALEEKRPESYIGEIVSDAEVLKHLNETRQRIKDEGLKTHNDVEEENKTEAGERSSTRNDLKEPKSDEENKELETISDMVSSDTNRTDVEEREDSSESKNPRATKEPESGDATVIVDLNRTHTEVRENLNRSKNPNNGTVIIDDNKDEVEETIKSNIKTFPLFRDKGVDEAKTAENEVLIRFKEGMEDSAEFQAKLEKYLGKNAHRLERFRAIGTGHIKSETKSTEELEKILKKSEFSEYIKSVTKNHIMHLSDTSDVNYGQIWAIENNGQTINNVTGTADADMDVAEAWEKTKGSNEVIVAVLDTGVDYTHSDLVDNMWQGNVNHGYDFAADNTGANDADPMPDLPYADNGHFHGTHVAGTIGAVANNSIGVTGVAQNVSIMALKVFRPDGAGYTSDILEALNYVSQKIDEGENIVAINASYGATEGSQSDTLNEVIKELGAKGVVFCAAAGNEGTNNDQLPVYPASYDASNIIAIAASDANDNIATFSNYGTTSVDVAAPGTNILSTYPGDEYAYLQGTSMATPNVAGTVALLATYYPNATANELKAMIINNVDVKSALNGKVVSNGRVNINEALGVKDAPVNNIAPIATNDSYVTAYMTAKSLDILSNDSDVDGDKLSVIEFTQADNGIVEQDNAQLRYIPNDGFSGEDSFRYTISDGEANATATVTMSVNEEEKVNTAPIANADQVETSYETSVSFNVLINDSDNENDTLAISEFTQTSNGTLRLDAGIFTYSPNSTFWGEDSFNYSVSDGLTTSTAKVTIAVAEKVAIESPVEDDNATEVETPVEDNNRTDERSPIEDVNQTRLKHPIKCDKGMKSKYHIKDNFDNGTRSVPKH